VRRGGWGLVIAVVTAGAVVLAPAPAGLSAAGQRTAAVFLLALALWVTESLPAAVVAVLAVALQPILGIQEARAAYSSFASPVFFFVLGMYCLATALVGSGIHHRFALHLLRRAGTDPKRVLGALLVGTATVSSIISDLPVCAVFMAVALGVFSRAGIEPGSAFGKAVMVGVPIAAFIGGVATPAGSSVNVLGLYFLEQYGKVRVPFLSWMALGIPMAIVLLPVAWWALLRAFPPERDRIGSAGEVERELAGLGPLTIAERKILVVLGALILLWLLSSWVPALDLALVTLGGSIVLFLPGVRLLTWEQAHRGVGWDGLLMIGGVTSLGAASIATGLAEWMVCALLGGVGAWPPALIVASISAFTVLAHLAVPIAPVITSVLIPPTVALAEAAGYSPAFFALPIAFTASCAFLLPLDAVSLLTYSKGYYRMLDMLRPGAWVSVVWVICMTVLMLILGPVLGFYS
jgi:sodium-dependent dicarboxylate transporter 2/3/5